MNIDWKEFEEFWFDNDTLDHSTKVKKKDIREVRLHLAKLFYLKVSPLMDVEAQVDPKAAQIGLERHAAMFANALPKPWIATLINKHNGNLSNAADELAVMLLGDCIQIADALSASLDVEETKIKEAKERGEAEVIHFTPHLN